MTDDLVKRLLGRTKQHLPGNWREGLKCPECDVMADRPKCMWDMGRSCPRHDPHNYEPSPFETKPDADCHEAADRIEALTAQLQAMKEAHDDVEQYARRHCAEVEALTAQLQDMQGHIDHADTYRKAMEAAEAERDRAIDDARDNAEYVDLVSRYRAERDEYKRSAAHSSDVVRAAKAEIERLGCALNVAKYGQPDFAWSVHLAAMAELRAEIDRLREALQFGFDLIDGDSFGPEWKRGCHDFKMKARAALKGQQP